jgi:hypothetical protein
MNDLLWLVAKKSDGILLGDAEEFEGMCLGKSNVSAE